MKANKTPNDKKPKPKKNKIDDVIVINKIQGGRIFLPRQNTHKRFLVLRTFLCMLPKGIERFIYKLTQRPREFQEPNNNTKVIIIPPTPFFCFSFLPS